MQLGVPGEDRVKPGRAAGASSPHPAIGADDVDGAEQRRRDGGAMSRDLDRLLTVKDDAHYGLLHVSAQRAAAALRQARRLVHTAAEHAQ
jgi:hypothetical protein